MKLVDDGDPVIAIFKGVHFTNPLLALTLLPDKPFQLRMLTVGCVKPHAIDDFV